MTARDQRSTDGPAAPAGDAPEEAVYGPSTRQLVMLIAAFWVASFLLAELRSVVDHSAKLPLYTLLRLLSAALGSAECWGLHFVAVHAARADWRLRAPLLILLAAAAGIANLMAIDALQNLSAFPVADYGAGWRIYKMSYWAMLFMVWTAIYLALGANREAVRQERQARRMERLAHDAQLRALRFQVDPHFLFNTLNSVSALLMAGRGGEAETMIERAADFFRMTLGADPRGDVTLAEELAVQRVYLDIERVRFPDLEIEVAVDPEAARVRVPALLLQPLLENAVKFARSGRAGRVRMGVSALRPQGGMVTIEVWDEGAGKPVAAKGTGTGLSNVRERLRGRFGAEARVDVLAREPRGTSVVLTFPAEASGSDAGRVS